MKSGDTESVNRAAFEGFRAALPTVKPYMFELADQILAAAPEANWDLQLCDDVGGRLPTYFTRRVLAEAGWNVPTRYVAGSKYHHEGFGDEAYEQYFQGIAGQLGKQSLNVLLTTEVTSLGGTMTYLQERLAPVASRIDTAAVVNRFPAQLTTTYAGGEGRQAASDIFFAFEAAPPSTLKGQLARKIKRHVPEFVSQNTPAVLKKAAEQPKNVLLGLAVPDYSSVTPTTSQYQSAPYRARAYQEIESLVTEYCGQRSMPLIPEQRQPRTYEPHGAEQYATF